MTEPATTAELLPYLSRPMTPPSAEVLIAIERGSIGVADALLRTQLDRLLDPAPLAAETGWCTFDDGIGYVAVRTPMPGVTGEMVEWWYMWNSRDPVRYQIWSPGAHDWTHAEEKGGPARAKRHWGVVNYPVEDIGLGMSNLRIEFAPPSQLGFSSDAVDDVAEAAAEDPPGPDVERPRRVWRRRGRQRLPEDLPRKRVEYELPPEELPCPDCGHDRTKIGEETSEQLEYVPSSLFVLVHARFRYACRACQEHVAIAAKPPQPIDKGLPGPGLLAQTITSKYGDHLPLYRLEDIFARHGVVLSRATLCGWMARSAELLTPLYDLMVRRVLQSIAVHTDDTTVPVWDPTLPKTRTGRFWVYVGDVRNPYVVYDYTPRRTRDGPERFLKGFRGYLQADAFSGYDRMCAGPEGDRESRAGPTSGVKVLRLADLRAEKGARRVVAHPAALQDRGRRRGALGGGPSCPAAAGFRPVTRGLRGVVDRAGPPRAAQEPDRSGDRLCSVQLDGAVSVSRALGAGHRQRDRFILHLVHGFPIPSPRRPPSVAAPCTG